MDKNSAQVGPYGTGAPLFEIVRLLLIRLLTKV